MLPRTSLDGSIDPVFRFTSYGAYDTKTWYTLQSSPRTDDSIGSYAASYKGSISLAVGHHVHMQRPALYNHPFIAASAAVSDNIQRNFQQYGVTRTVLIHKGRKFTVSIKTRISYSSIKAHHKLLTGTKAASGRIYDHAYFYDADNGVRYFNWIYTATPMEAYDQYLVMNLGCWGPSYQSDAKEYFQRPALHSMPTEYSHMYENTVQKAEDT